MRSRLFLAVLACMTVMPLSGCFLFKGAVVLIDDSAIACSNSPVTIDVLNNDIIGSKVTITAVTISTAPDASLGAAVVNSDNTITFTPVTDAVGKATFQYQVCYTFSKWKGSSSENCKTAEVTVYVRGAATVVTATDDTDSTTAGKSVRVNVLSNDSISDGGTPTITSVTTPSIGTASIVTTHSGQRILYTPPDDTTTGDATFQYTISDGCVGTATANVTVTVDAPAAKADHSLASILQHLFSSVSTSTCQAPAKVLLVNSSNFEITVFVGGKQVDVVQPLGSTVVPAKVAAGDNQEVRVEALLPDPDPARVTTSSFSFAPKGRYTITYTDNDVDPAEITIVDTP